MLECSPEVKIGGVYSSRAYGDFEVLEIKNSRNVKIMFVLTGTVKITRACHVLSGSVKDNYFPSIFGEGYLGEIENCTKAFYKRWFAMMVRCYGDPTGEKFPAYQGCKVSEEFKDYSKFEKWCESQLGASESSWELDKDILSRGSKIYSSETCCFVPQEVNVLVTKRCIRSKPSALLSGVSFHKQSGKYRASLDRKHIGLFNKEWDAFLAYKFAKEDKIRMSAEKWKGIIDDRVYNSLMNWTIKP